MRLVLTTGVSQVGREGGREVRTEALSRSITYSNRTTAKDCTRR